MARVTRLNHTADAGFRVEAKTLPELFAGAASALVGLALDASHAQPLEQCRLNLTGGSPEDLLVNWLNEIIWLLDTGRIVPVRYELQFGQGRLSASLWGEPRSDSRHPPRLVVKGATWHGLRLERTGGGWVAEVVLDV